MEKRQRSPKQPGIFQTEMAEYRQTLLLHASSVDNPLPQRFNSQSSPSARSHSSQHINIARDSNLLRTLSEQLQKQDQRPSCAVYALFCFETILVLLMQLLPLLFAGVSTALHFILALLVVPFWGGQFQLTRSLPHIRLVLFFVLAIFGIVLLLKIITYFCFVYSLIEASVACDLLSLQSPLSTACSGSPASFSSPFYLFLPDLLQILSAFFLLLCNLCSHKCISSSRKLTYPPIAQKIACYLCIYLLAISSLLTQDFFKLCYLLVVALLCTLWGLTYHIYRAIFQRTAPLLWALTVLVLICKFIFTVSQQLSDRTHHILQVLGIGPFSRHSAITLTDSLLILIIALLCVIFLRLSRQTDHKRALLKKQTKHYLRRHRTSGSQRITEKVKALHTLVSRRQKPSYWSRFKSFANTYILSATFTLLFTRVLLIFFIYQFLSLEGLLLFGWLIHSLLFHSFDKFALFTLYFYFPLFALFFAFLYLLNIHSLFSRDSFFFLQPSRYSLYGLIYKQNPQLYFFLAYLLLFFFSSIFRAFIFEKAKRARLQAPDRERRRAQTELPSSSAPHKVAWYEVVCVMLLSYLDTFLTIALYFVACLDSSAYSVIFILFLLLFVSLHQQGQAKYKALLLYLVLVLLQHYVYALFWPFWSERPDLTSNSAFNRAARLIGLFPSYSQDTFFVGSESVTEYSYSVQWATWILLLCVYFEHSLFKSKLLKNDARNYEDTPYFYESRVKAYLVKQYPRCLRFLFWLQCAAELFLEWGFLLILGLVVLLRPYNLLNFLFALFLIALLVLILKQPALLAESLLKARLRRAVWACFAIYSGIVVLFSFLFQLTYIDSILDSYLRPLYLYHTKIGLLYYSEDPWQIHLHTLLFILAVIIQHSWRVKSMGHLSSLFLPQFLTKRLASELLGVQTQEEGSFSLLYSNLEYIALYKFFSSLAPFSAWIEVFSYLFFEIMLIVLFASTIHWRLSLLSFTQLLITLIYYCKHLFTKYRRKRQLYQESKLMEEPPPHRQKDRLFQYLNTARTTSRTTLYFTRKPIWNALLYLFLIGFGLTYLSDALDILLTMILPASKYLKNVENIQRLKNLFFWLGCDSNLSGRSFWLSVYGYASGIIWLCFAKPLLDYQGDKYSSEILTQLLPPQQGTPMEEDQQDSHQEQEDSEEVKLKTNLVSAFEFSSDEEEQDRQIRRSVIVSRHSSAFSRSSPRAGSFNLNIPPPDPLQAERKRWKYILLMMSGVKTTFELLLLLLLVLGLIFKHDLFSLCYFCLLASSLCLQGTHTLKFFRSAAAFISCFLALQYALQLLTALYSSFPLNPPEQLVFSSQPYSLFPEPNTSFLPIWDSIPESYLALAQFCGVRKQASLDQLWLDFWLLVLLNVHAFLFCDLVYEQHSLIEFFSQDEDQRISHLSPSPLIRKITTRYSKPKTTRINLQEALNLTDSFTVGADLSSKRKPIERRMLGPSLSRSLSSVSMLQQDASRDTSTQATPPPDTTSLLEWLYESLRRLLFEISFFATTVVVLLIALLGNGLLTLPYILFAMSVIFRAKNYYSEQWRLVHYLTYLMLPYSLLDILLQLVFQLPLDAFAPPVRWADVLGIEKYPENIDRFVQKSFIFFFLTAQRWILLFPSYIRFRAKFLRNFRLSAQYRAAGFTFLFNNRRLASVTQAQLLKLALTKKLVELRRKIRRWNRKFLFVEQDMERTGSPQTSKRLPLMHSSQESSKINNRSNSFRLSKSLAKIKPPFESSGTSDPEDVRKASFLSLDYLAEEQEKLVSRLSPKSYFQRTTSPILAAQLADQQHKLNKGMSLRLYFWLYQKMQSKLLFLGLEGLKEEVSYLANGNESYICPLAELYEEANKEFIRKEKMEAISAALNRSATTPREELGKAKKSKKGLQATPKLDEFKRKTSCASITGDLCKLLPKVIISQSEFLCFFFMLLDHFMNPSLLNLIYPVSIFCYALLQHNRPHPRYWAVMLAYASIVVLVKFALQLAVWRPSLQSSALLRRFYDPSNIGLRLFDSTASFEFFNYIIWDNIVILCICLHFHILLACGLDRSSERNLQSLQAAMSRTQEQQIKAAFDISFDPGQSLDNSSLVANSPSRRQLLTQPSYLFTPFLTDEELRPLLDRKPVKSEQLPNRVDDPFSSNESSEFDLLEDSIYRPYNVQRRCMSDGDLQALKLCYSELVSTSHLPRSCWFRCKKNCSSCVKKSNFLEDLFPTLKQEKPGHDYYNIKVSLQIVMALWIFLLFPLMQGSYVSGSGFIEYSSFSGNMVIAFIIQIFLILSDRFFYITTTFTAQLDNKQSLHYLKQSQRRKIFILIYLVLNLALLEGLVLWFFPIYGNQLSLGKDTCDDSIPQDVARCNNLSNNWAAQIFFFLGLVYLYIFALQIKDGLPEVREGLDLERSDSRLRSIAFKTFLKVPFVWELKVLADWTFSKTALDIYQWFRFENIFATTYVAKWNMFKYWNRPEGLPQPFCSKFIFGFLILLGLLVLLVLPLLIFSTLFEFNSVSPVLNATLQLSVQFESPDSSRSIVLFKTGFASQVQALSSQDYESLQFGSARALNHYDQQLIQEVVLQPYSEQLFLLTPEQTNFLSSRLHSQVVCSPLTSEKLFFSMRYSLEQKSTSAQSHLSYDVQDSPQCRNIVDQLQLAIKMSCPPNGSSQQVQIDQLYTETLRLEDNGIVEPIFDPDHGYRYETNATLTLICDPGTNTTFESKYWELMEQGEQARGVPFYIFRERVSGTFAGITAIGFYVTIVLAVGRLLRTVFAGPIEVIYTDQYKPGEVLQLCEGLIISRIEKKLVREDQLYKILIDLMRSPEVLKIVTKPRQQFKLKDD